MKPPFRCEFFNWIQLKWLISFSRMYETNATAFRSSRSSHGVGVFERSRLHLRLIGNFLPGMRLLSRSGNERLDNSSDSLGEILISSDGTAGQERARPALLRFRLSGKPRPVGKKLVGEYRRKSLGAAWRRTWREFLAVAVTFVKIDARTWLDLFRWRSMTPRNSFTPGLPVFTAEIGLFQPLHVQNDTKWLKQK